MHGQAIYVRAYVNNIFLNAEVHLNVSLAGGR